jgi:hypothetical protein
MDDDRHAGQVEGTSAARLEADRAGTALRESKGLTKELRTPSLDVLW